MLRNPISWITSLITLFAGLQLAATDNTTSTFEEVDGYLEKGGIIYAILDVEGDIANLSFKAEEMLQAMSQMNPQIAMVASVPVSTLMEQTGLTAIRAVGISSTRRDPGFENRTIILTENGLPGLLGFYGRKNQPFDMPGTAPAGTDVLVESSTHPAVLTNALREMATIVMGEQGSQMIDLYLGRPLGTTKFTAGELLEALQGNYALVLDVSESETMEIQKLGQLPKVDFVLQLESAGVLTSKLAEFLQQVAPSRFKAQVNGDILTMSGFLPEAVGLDLILQGNQATGELILTSSLAYLDACRNGTGTSLAESAVFQEVTSGLAQEGISLTYATSDINRLIDAYVDLILKTEPQNAEAMRPYMEWMMSNFHMDFPVASVTSVEDNGLFTQSHWNASHKRNLAALAYANPVTIGLMAAMAIPAFQKVRETSQQKAITNNLRQLASAAQQYMLEEGAMSVRTEDLIGPDAYIYSFEPVIGETYPDVITAEMTEIEAILPDGKAVVYQF